MDTNQLQEILVKHKMYVNREQGGVRANLRDVDLRNVDLHNVDLTCADLLNANLRGANLHNADLTCANLHNANLRNVDLRNANLRNANLRGANLHNADLRDANLENTNLLGANLYNAVGIVSFGPIGRNRRIGYAVKHDAAVMIQLGCFWGTVETAKEAIRIKYGENSTYEILVIAAANALLL